MRTGSIGKLTLGLLLLVLGIALVLQLNYGYQNALDTVLRYWPLAIILLGLEFVFAARDPESRARVSVGAILGMALVIGAAWTYSFGPFPFYLGHGLDFTINAGHESYSVQVPVNEPFGTGSTKLEVQAIGDVTLTGGPDHAVTGIVTVLVRARSQSEARKIAESLAVSALPVGGTLLIEVPRPRGVPQYVAIQSSYSLSVPSAADIVSKTISGNTRINGVTGDILTGTVSGDVSVDSSPRSLSVDVVSGDVSVTLNKDMKSFSVKSVSGDVNITAPAGTGGKLSFSAVSGDVNSSLPGIQVTSKPGHKSASGTFGTGATTIDVTTISGDITIR